MSKTLVVAALAALVFSAPAQAKTFRGKTNQHRKASLVTGADGVPKRVRVAYKARCRKTPYVTGFTVFTPPFVSATADAVSDGGTTANVKSKTHKGETARITTTLQANRAGAAWSGLYTVKLVLRYHGRRIDTCRARKVTWTAK
jgi:hypothetical protein